MNFSHEIQQALSDPSPIPLRVAIIKELDRAERSGRCAVIDLVDAISLRRGDVVVPDDGAVDLAKDSQDAVVILKAALRTNFSREKISRIEALISNKRHHSGAFEEEPQRHGSASDGGLVELSKEASLKSISLVDVRTAIIKELDRDAKRMDQCALRAADEADARLQANGLSLYDIDDESVDFRDVRLASVGQDVLHYVKGALRTNFSREKVAYAARLIVEFRQRGIPGYLAKDMVSIKIGERASRLASGPSLRTATAHVEAMPKISQGSPRVSAAAKEEIRMDSDADDRNRAGRDTAGGQTRTSSRVATGWATWTAIASAVAALVFIIVKKFR